MEKNLKDGIEENLGLLEEMETMDVPDLRCTEECEEKLGTDRNMSP